MRALLCFVSQCRPEFEGELRLCPYLHQPERYYPWQRRAAKVAVSGLLLLCLTALSCGAMLWLFLAKDGLTNGAAPAIPGSGSGSDSGSDGTAEAAAALLRYPIEFAPVLWGLFFPFYDEFYQRVAKTLNNWENWKTVREYAHPTRFHFIIHVTLTNFQ